MSINIPNFTPIFSQKDVREPATAELLQKFKVKTDSTYILTSSYADTLTSQSVDVGSGQAVLILYDGLYDSGAGNYLNLKFQRNGGNIGQVKENIYAGNSGDMVTISKNHMETPGVGNFTYSVQAQNDDNSGSLKDQTFIIIVFNKRS